MFYSVAVRKEEKRKRRACIKCSKGNSAHYCGMRKQLQTNVYILCNSAVVYKSGKTGSACEESWVIQTNIMESKKLPAVQEILLTIRDGMVVEYMGDFRNTVYIMFYSENLPNKTTLWDLDVQRKNRRVLHEDDVTACLHLQGDFYWFLFYVFCTVHWDIIMQHKPTKCTILKWILWLDFSVFDVLYMFRT